MRLTREPSQETPGTRFRFISLVGQFVERFDINIGQFLFARPMIMDEIKRVVHGYGVLMNFRRIER